MGLWRTAVDSVPTQEEPRQPAAFPHAIPSRKPYGRKLAELLAVLLVIGAGVALRLYRIEEESLWIDEAVSVRHLNEPRVLGFLRVERNEDPPMLPVYFVLQYGWARLFGDSLVTLRLMGIVLWVGGAALLYRLGRELFGSLGGFTALLMYSFSITHAYYSQEIRMYALVVPLATASVLTLVLAVKRGGVWWRLHLLINALILWTHMFASLLLAAEGLWLLLAHRQRWKHWLIWGAAHSPYVAAVAVWMLGMNFIHLADVAAWIPMPSWDWLPLTLAWGPTWIPVSLPFLRVGVAALALALAVIFGMAVLRRDRDIAAKGLLLVLWLLVPSLGVILVSYLHGPAAVPRYIIYGSLAFYLLVAAAVSLLPSRGLQVLALVMLAGLLAAQVVQTQRPMRMQWQQVAAVVAAGAADGDIVVTSPGYQARTLRWYKPVPRYAIVPLESADGVVQLTLSEGHAVWFACSPRENYGQAHPGDRVDLSGATQEGGWFLYGAYPMHVYRFAPKKD